MIEKDKVLNKYKITAIILLVVSVAFNFLQQPVFYYFVLPEQGIQIPTKIFTFSFYFFLLVIEAVLIGTYIFFHNNKIVSKFFSVALVVDIISRVCSLIFFIKLLVISSMRLMSTIYIAEVIFSIAYLIMYAFLFIDSLKKHKFLEISRTVMWVITTLKFLSLIMHFVDNNVMYVIVSNYGFLLVVAFLIYYLYIAENKNKVTLENELHRLKTEYESGNITAEEYANAMQSILNSL